MPQPDQQLAWPGGYRAVAAAQQYGDMRQDGCNACKNVDDHEATIGTFCYHWPPYLLLAM